MRGANPPVSDTVKGDSARKGRRLNPPLFIIEKEGVI